MLHKTFDFQSPTDHNLSIFAHYYQQVVVQVELVGMKTVDKEPVARALEVLVVAASVAVRTSSADRAFAEPVLVDNMDFVEPEVADKTPVDSIDFVQVAVDTAPVDSLDFEPEVADRAFADMADFEPDSASPVCHTHDKSARAD